MKNDIEHIKALLADHENTNFAPHIVANLVAEVEALRPKAEAWDNSEREGDAIEAAFMEKNPGFEFREDPMAFTCPGCGAARSGFYCSGCGTRRDDELEAAKQDLAAAGGPSLQEAREQAKDEPGRTPGEMLEFLKKRRQEGSSGDA